MSTERRRRVAALKKQYETQRAEWLKAIAALERVGDEVRFQVSARVAQMLEDAGVQDRATTPLCGVRA